MNIAVTGASRGLGFEIAKKFVQEGHNVAICSRKLDEIKKAKNKLSHFKLTENQKIFAWMVDVKIEDEIRFFISEVIGCFGSIDVSINNAGIYGPFGNIENTNSQDWEQCIKTNLLGPYCFMKHVIPHMKENQYGKIINIAGGGATQPMPFISAYAASKTALVRLSESIAEEVKDYNIDVNCVSPGLLDTNMYQQVLDAGPEKVGKEFYEKITKKEKTPLSSGAELCYWLASKASDGVTGRLISAAWDDYMNPVFKTILKQDKDLYTLRRKV